MKGHIRKLDNGRYIARFPVAGARGKFKSKTFDRKQDAKVWLNLRNRPDWVDATGGDELLGSVAESWLASRRDVAASTRSRDASYLRNQVIPYLGDVPLRHVTVERLDEWVAHLDDIERLSPATTQKAFQIVSMVLDRAVGLRKIATNPARSPAGVSLPALTKAEMRFLEPKEVDELASTIDPDYRTLVLTAAYTGARWGELVGLKARYLDLDKGRLTIAEVMAEVDSKLSFKEPKTSSSRRTIALPALLVEALTEHLSSRPVVGNALVFTDSEGGPLRRSNFRRRIWRPAVAESVGEPMRFHDLRHTHAAWLIAQGEHPKTIQARLGHASISTTLDRYGHLMTGLDEAAANRLNEFGNEREKHSGSTNGTTKVTRIENGKRETSSITL